MTTPLPPLRGLRGLYAITPDDTDAERLADRVARVLEGGVDALQFRVKGGAAAEREALARRIKALADAAGVPLIVNDDVDLAIAIDAAGVHVGRDDGDPAAVRARIGPLRWLGVSCYDDIERARGVRGIADHVGFGSVFASPTKPAAVRAPLSLFGQARGLGLSAVAIGGIDRDNAHLPIEAGADAVAVITDLFGAGDPAAAARILRARVQAALARREDTES
ncbi:MAG: thiamine phosphate synthase [Burkholderiales bacterium]|nr:MAG: thiamine phosphate synthase [Burkholderiales bacterium]